MRDRRPTGVIDLRGRAWEDIQRHVDETLRRWEIVETGGHLFCDRNDPRHDPRRILRASGPGGGHAAPDAIQITLRDAVELTRNQPHLKRAGIWHSHPGGQPWPSEPDLGISRRRAEENGGTQLDLIITGGAIGLTTPVATAWLMHRREGAWVAEPLHALTD
jgi:hypothetical protein